MTDKALVRESAEHIHGLTSARDRPRSDSGDLALRIDSYLKGLSS